jgi:hypothetical protein
MLGCEAELDDLLLENDFFPTQSFQPPGQTHSSALISSEAPGNQHQPRAFPTSFLFKAFPPLSNQSA